MTTKRFIRKAHHKSTALLLTAPRHRRHDVRSFGGGGETEKIWSTRLRRHAHPRRRPARAQARA